MLLLEIWQYVYCRKTKKGAFMNKTVIMVKIFGGGYS